MRKWDKFWFYGLWSIPLTSAGVYLLLQQLDTKMTIINILITSLTIALVMALYIVATNYGKYIAGQRHFTPFSAFSGAPTQFSHSHKTTAMSPPVPPELMHKKHCNMIFGKSEGRYVGIEYQGGVCGHCIIVGQSGCGKTSSVLIPLLLQVTESRLEGGMSPDKKEKKESTSPDNSLYT